VKKIGLNFLVTGLLWILASCHKEENDLSVPQIMLPQPAKEIFANLDWKYDTNRKTFYAKLTDLGEVGSALSADSIKAVYQFASGAYVEIPHGNPGISSYTYYEIELKKLMLYKKFQFPGDATSSGVPSAMAIVIAKATGGLYLPEKAKVVFQ